VYDRAWQVTPRDTDGGEFEFAGTARFEIKRRLGAGGMGVVYEAYDRERETSVALKTLRHLDAQGLYRFKREFRALQDLEHPNLVRLGELINERGQWFLTMELLHGVDILSHVCGARPGDNRSGVSPSEDTLRSEQSTAAVWIDREHIFDEPRLRSSMRQLALGLAALHEAGKIHRDIKPTNVMVDEEGRVVLLDFGLMTHHGGGESSEVRIVGTASYMAPEQAASKRVGPPADWYSFGIVLYEALTGRLPFQGSDLEILMDKQRYEPAKPSSLLETVPADLDDLCMGLLRSKPDARPSGRRVLERLGVTTERQREMAERAPSRFTQTMPFVGRDDELAALHSALDESRPGRTVTVFVVGESGMGKTELVRRFLDELRLGDEEVVILEGRCYERETVPYKAFDGVADSLSRYMVKLPMSEAAALLPRRAALLGRLFPVLRRVEPVASSPVGHRETVDPQELRARMFRAFRELLQKLAERAQVVLYVDDFQWADADSLTMMSEVFHQPDPPSALFLATARNTKGDTASGTVDAASNLLEDVRSLEIGPLQFEAARQLVELASPALTAEDPDYGEKIAREAEGHPLFIQELVRHLEANASQDLSAISLDGALWSRIAKLDARARELLEILAVAGAPITQEVAAIACRQEPTGFEQSVAQLRVAFLARTAGARSIDTIETYHDRVRDSVLANLSDEEQRERHHEVAIALDRAGYAASQPQVLVRHLEGAGEATRAAELAERAAQRSADALAFDRAAELYRECLRLGVFSADKERDLRLRLGETLINSGRGAEAADALIAAAEHADTTTRMECRRRAAEQLLSCGHIGRGVEVVSDLLAEIGTSLPATPKRALLHLLWCRVKLRLRGLKWKERHEREIADAELTRLDVFKAVGIGLNMADTIRGADFQARHLLLALRVGEPLRVGRALAHEACYLSTQGERGRKRAQTLTAESKRILDRHPDPYLEGWVLTAEALVNYMGGQFRLALDPLSQGEKIFFEQTVGKTWELNTMRLFKLFTLRHLGEIGQLRDLSNEYMRDARRRGDLLTETSMRRVRNIAWLAEGKPEQALVDLERAAWIPPHGTYHLQHWYELESRGELALYEGRAAQALVEYAPDFDLLSSSLLVRIQIVRAISRWLRGRLALAAAEAGIDAAANVGDAKRCATQLAREDAAYGEVWSSLLEGGIAAQAGNQDRARTLLARAADAARRQDMSHCLAAAQYRRGELIGGKAGDRLVEQAVGWMLEKSVTASKRRVQVIAPGFTHR